ncbi:hypothetical protein QR680_008950 [Steinernema hermaphroditum]|uniref:Uncharacterized protein n=1 Tax=Steinernema hermaphroditum TaxID=289476 RepID=A0AA39IJX2_9BILA|nr:hypothetical protein QR680_008950 [Steinernema hermaphroditum]
MTSSKLISFSLFVFFALALTRAEDRCDCASIVAQKEESIGTLTLIHVTIQAHLLGCEKRNVDKVEEYMGQQLSGAMDNNFKCPAKGPSLKAIDGECESLNRQVVLFNAVVRDFYRLQGQACGCGCVKA